RYRLIKPGLQLLRRPGQSLIQMAKIAGIRAAEIDTFSDGRTGDLMAAHRMQQSVGRPRHMTVIAATTGALGRLVSVIADLLSHRLVTLQTSFVRIHLCFQLPASSPFF